jgi:hypothetical protein
MFDTDRRSFLATVGIGAFSGLAHSADFAFADEAGSKQQRQIAFTRKRTELEITIGGRPFATYVFRDEKILRPFFANVFSPSGIQATRPHPPRAGQDLTDHATMHPGIWLAFGDISGADFWRNKARVEHVGFTRQLTDATDSATFSVRNRYVSGEKTICTETCRHAIHIRPNGYLLVYDSTFTGEMPFTFGDQEEMGLGVRVASSLRVQGGQGQIQNAAGLQDEKQVWGKTSDWCDYSGITNKQRVGMLLMPHPENFRASWFHARDYGFVAANPFGRMAFTRGEKSQVVVKQGETFRLRFGVLIHSEPEGLSIDGKSAFADYLKVESDPTKKSPLPDDQ